MKILANGIPNIIITKCEEFLKETNKNKLKKEFLEKCKKALKLFKEEDNYE